MLDGAVARRGRGAGVPVLSALLRVRRKLTVLQLLTLAAALLTGAAFLPAARGEGPAVQERRCDRIPVRARGATTEDLSAACDGAERAVAFFANLDLALTQPTLIDMAARLPSGTSKTAVACYNLRTGGVTVLTYEAFAQRKTWFGVPVDRELHRSAVAHEVGHAIVGCQASVTGLSNAAHEYLAFVTMLATMSPPLRERVLATAPDGRLDDESQFNSLILAFDPLLFGVEAWRHFSRQSDPKDYVRQILAGRVLKDPVRIGD
jgi:hypothetical protein